ncbi:unnamed protein product [Orchesella dallaii]|uniref:Death domain-containing protein n=1 Tax=Orchesella dallaii TaxID=48710 RepID=A0ABP1QD44_9HEXA
MNLGSTLIIGDEPCTFNAVCETLINAKTATVILSKPMELARSLKIPSDKFVEIREKNGHTSAPSLLFEIVTSWRAQKSSGATLQAFVLVLESLQWNDCADELKKKFCQFESTSFQDSPIYKPVLSPTLTQNMDSTDTDTSSTSTPANTFSKPQWPSDSLPEFHSSIPKCPYCQKWSARVLFKSGEKIRQSRWECRLKAIRPAYGQ